MRTESAGCATLSGHPPAPRARAWLRAIGLALAIAPIAVAAAGFMPLDLPGSQAAALSADGCVVAGNLLGGDGGGFRWSPAAGAERLPAAVVVHGLSPSGRYVAGAILDDLQRQLASYWDEAGVAHRLGSMPGIESLGVVSQAQAITDEPRVVGSARRSGGGSVAFEWTARHGMRALPGSDTAASTRAVGLRDRDRRVIGWVQGDGTASALTWRDGVAEPLRSTLDGAGVAAELTGASVQAHTVFGLITQGGSSAAAAFRWRDGRTLEPLVTPPEPTARFHAASADGRVLVGGSERGGRREPWWWTAEDGFVALPDLLVRHGIGLPDGWELLALTAVSDDGTRLAGWGRHAGRLDSFVVDLGGAGHAACAARGPAAALRAP